MERSAPVPNEKELADVLVGVVLGYLLADKAFRKRFDPRLMPLHRQGEAAKEIILGRDYDHLRGILAAAGLEWDRADGNPLKAILERMQKHAAGAFIRSASQRSHNEWDWEKCREWMQDAIAKSDAMMTLDVEGMANGGSNGKEVDTTPSKPPGPP